jgi:hypothetical protein
MIKLFAHTAVDAYELCGEFALRFMKRAGILERYIRAVIKLMEAAEGPMLRPEDIDTLVALAESSDRPHAIAAMYWHSVIDERTFRPKFIDEDTARRAEIEALTSSAALKAQDRIVAQSKN